MIVNRCPRCTTRAVLPDLLDDWLCYACGAIPERDPRQLEKLEAEATLSEERRSVAGAVRHPERTAAA